MLQKSLHNSYLTNWQNTSISYHRWSVFKQDCLTQVMVCMITVCVLWGEIYTCDASSQTWICIKPLLLCPHTHTHPSLCQVPLYWPAQMGNWKIGLAVGQLPGLRFKHGWPCAWDMVSNVSHYGSSCMLLYLPAFYSLPLILVHSISVCLQWMGVQNIPAATKTLISTFSITFSLILDQSASWQSVVLFKIIWQVVSVRVHPHELDWKLFC